MRPHRMIGNSSEARTLATTPLAATLCKVDCLSFLASEVKIAASTSHYRRKMFLVTGRWIAEILRITNDRCPATSIQNGLHNSRNIGSLGIARIAAWKRTENSELHRKNRRRSRNTSAVIEIDRLIFITR